jgi:hypothetical protein
MNWKFFEKIREELEKEIKRKEVRPNVYEIEWEGEKVLFNVKTGEVYEAQDEYRIKRGG